MIWTLVQDTILIWSGQKFYNYQVMNQSEEFELNNQGISTVTYEAMFTPQFIEIYQRALHFSNLEIGKDLHYRNVQIYQNDHIHELYTSSPQNRKLPHLVLLHGYGGTSLMFIRTFELLQQFFQVHALDTFGIGLSSIGAYHDQMTTPQVIDYYTGALEEWRKAVGIETFVLAGHSFGGYISALYLEKHPNQVSKLILLSPAGTTSFTEEEMNQKLAEASVGRKFFYCLAEKVYNLNVRPFKAMDNCIIGKRMIESVLNNRLKLEKDQKDAWKSYLQSIIKVENTSQTGFYKLFKWPLQPDRSIQTIVEQNQFEHPIHIFFGDDDWMEKKGALSLSQKFANIKYSIIEGAGHQLIFDNPRSVAEKIIKILNDSSDN